MFHFLRSPYMLLVLIALLPGCSSATNQEPIYIGSKTNAALQSYLATIGSVGSGAFAVSPNGRTAFYSYCIDSYCGSISMTQDALLHCKGLAGTDCVILANGTNIVRPYRVGSAGSAETVPPLKGSDIQQRVAGNTLSGFYSDGTQWKIFFDSNHQAHVIDGSRKLSGTWQINGDRLCLDYPGTNDDWCGEFRISTFHGDKQTLDVYRDGKLWRSMDMPTTVPGNPWNL